MNKELEEKIITYLKKLEKGEVSSEISNKKKNLLLASKREYEKLDQEQKDYQELSFKGASKEERDLLLVEIENIEKQKEELISKIKEQIIEEENISQNIIMEIRPGPGGDEAGLFVNDLYCMYASFAKNKG